MLKAEKILMKKMMMIVILYSSLIF